MNTGREQNALSARLHKFGVLLLFSDLSAALAPWDISI